MAMKRATAVKLAAAGVLGAASMVCGGGLVALVPALVGDDAAKDVKGMLQGVVTELLSGVFADNVDEEQARSDKARRNQQNHDLQRAISLAIAKCVRRAVAASPSGGNPPAYLTAIADAIDANPLSLELTQLDEAAITTIMSSGTSTSWQEPLSADQWRELLETAAIETQASLSLNPRIDVQTGVEFCQRYFGEELIQTFKALGADSDPAWFALVLRYLREIHAGVRATQNDVAELQQDFAAQRIAIESLSRAFAGHAESMSRAIDALRSSYLERGWTADVSVLELIMTNMGDLSRMPTDRRALDVETLALRRPPLPPEWPLEPYPLLAPYSREETFAGRDRDVSDCLQVVTLRCKLTLCLHAPSGAGKSSLLEAGLLPRLRQAGYAACLERHPGEPGLAQRLAAQLFELPLRATVDDGDPLLFRRLMVRAHQLAQRPPVLLLDQIDDFLRDDLTREATLARLGPLMAATAHSDPGLGGCPCRWVLCCRRDFLGDVMAWLRDVLRDARRAGRVDVMQLPADLSGLDRCDTHPLPMMGEVSSSYDSGAPAASAFLDAIRKPLALRDERGRIRYPVRFEGDGDLRLAEAFGRAREEHPHQALVPELQVVLSHLLSSASTQGYERVVRVPSNVDTFIADALSRHLVRALERAFPLERGVPAMKQGRARALLALRDLADEQKRRGKGLPEPALKSAIGDDAENVLGRLSDATTRLVVRPFRSSDGIDHYALAHDCLVDVITRGVETIGALGDFAFDERVVELRRFVGMRADLFGRASDQAALELDDEQYDLIEAHQHALITGESRKWWEQCQLLRTDLDHALGWRRRPAFRVAAVKRVLLLRPDPRFRADAWWLPRQDNLGFVEVPGGSFRMGSTDDDREAWDEERSQHEVTVESFFIARWPVTVAQFRAFVDDAEDNESFSMNTELLARGGRSDPVTMVSWHDAQAYCRWLTRKLAAWAGTPPALADRLRGTNVRWRVALPSESEWEKAARGVDARIYSWGGGGPDPSLANFFDTGVGGTSPVGCFPDGAGPSGVEEMAGNVWEWTRTLWGAQANEPDFAYPYDPSDGRESEDAGNEILRVLRGGSYLNTRGHLRAACRGRSAPRKRDFDVGFRVVISPVPGDR